MARSTFGSECRTSDETHDNNPCLTAIGGDFDTMFLWSGSPNVSIWINITFNATYRLTAARFRWMAVCDFRECGLLFNYVGGHSEMVCNLLFHTNTVIAKMNFYKIMKAFDYVILDFIPWPISKSVNDEGVGNMTNYQHPGTLFPWVMG